MTPLLINFLLTLGGSLGAAFIKSPQLQQVVSTGISSATQFVTLLTNRTSASITPQLFLTAMQAAIGILLAEGKLTADEAGAISKALTDTLAADTAAQAVVDPTTLNPIQPLP